MNDAVHKHKQQIAMAALAYVQPGQLIGVGTGSTVHYFIEALAAARVAIKGAVASSEATAAHLKAKGIAVVPLDEVTDLPIYIDSADVVDAQFHLIKGGGGALTREKVIAYASRQFVCMVDYTKWREDLRCADRPPLPIEVLPMACTYVKKTRGTLGGEPNCRLNFTTDNHNIILDVKGLDWSHLLRLEERLNQIPGTVANGLFVCRRPDQVLLSTAEGQCKTLHYSDGQFL